MFRLLGRRERSLSCDGHLYFFTNQSLRNLYQAAGFQKVRLDAVGRSLTVDRLLWNVGGVSKSRGVKTALGSLSRTLGLQKVHLYLNLRDMQRVCVQKARAVAEGGRQPPGAPTRAAS
jgi:hypothetical protein